MHSVCRRLITRSQNGCLRHFCERQEYVKSFKKAESFVKTERSFGQPTYETHPHLLNKGEVTPLITKEEYQDRRGKLVEKLLQHAKRENRSASKHIVIIPGATKKYMSDKIPYIFRQNSEFLYLTGCQEPDCCLVATVGEDSPASFTLFTREKDPHAELWDGPRTYPEDAPEFFGVDSSLPITELEKFVNSYKNNNKNVAIWYDFLNPVQDIAHKIVTNVILNTTSKSVVSPVNLIHELRLIKSPAEISLMQKSCDVASEAIAESIAFSTPGCSEHQIFAKVDYECRMKGADFLAYPPVVAGGERATIIHYINNNKIVNPNELVLMDAGCEYHGYSSDITRTWPISGKFTKEQRLVYEIVYEAQKDLINFCKEFPTLTALFDEMCILLGKNLQQAKLIGSQPSIQYLMKSAYQLCPHHVSHYLGMDVHDTPSIKRNVPIKPGMIITIEPGIYISGKEKNIPTEFHGIGIRIEDDILITEDGPVVLTRNCPKTVEDIERLASQNN